MRILTFFLSLFILLSFLNCNNTLFKKGDQGNSNEILYLGAIGYALGRGCQVNLSNGSSYSAPNILLTQDRQFLGFKTQPSISTITVSLKANQVVHITSTETSLNTSYIGYFKSPKCPIEASLSDIFPVNTAPFHVSENTKNSIKVYSDVDGDYVLYLELDFYDKSNTYKNDIFARKE